METKFKVIVPKPCHEDWDTMTPEENGRFCSVCTKGVVDFTTKSAAEIQQYFTEHKEQKICGRFKNEQVNRLTIPIPKSVLEQQMPFHKAFLLTLFIVMGSTLFSCKNHNNDFVTGEPVVVEDTIKKIDTPLTKDTVAAPIDTIHATLGIVTCPTSEEKNHIGTENEKLVYQPSQVEILPNYPGGIANLFKDISSNFKISDDNKDITGKIIVSFIVETNGDLSNIKIQKGINDELNSEAIRVLKTIKKWSPGEQNGQKVRVSYSIPIKITSEH